MKSFITLIITGLLLIACDESSQSLMDPSGCSIAYGCPLEQYANFLQLELPEQVFPEQLFDVSVKFDQPVSKVTGHLEGVSMFMGKIPLILNSQSNNQHYTTQTVVGSCTDERMKWRLILSWQQDGELVKTYHEFVIAHSP